MCFNKSLLYQRHCIFPGKILRNGHLCPRMIEHTLPSSVRLRGTFALLEVTSSYHKSRRSCSDIIGGTCGCQSRISKGKLYGQHQCWFCTFSLNYCTLNLLCQMKLNQCVILIVDCFDSDSPHTAPGPSCGYLLSLIQPQHT